MNIGALHRAVVLQREASCRSPDAWRRVVESRTSALSLTILAGEQEGNLHNATNTLGPLIVGHGQQSEGALRREGKLGVKWKTQAI